MPKDDIKSTAITAVGVAYQTLHGIHLLCDWLDAPSRYVKVRFECTDQDIAPRSLDDIVAIRPDGRCDYWQVKYTPNPANNLFTWNWLLHVEGTTSRARSNIKKWFDAVKKIAPATLGSVQLVTNRIPNREIEMSLGGSDRLDLDKAPTDVQNRIVTALGNRAEAIWFFSLLRVVHSDKNYLNLQNAIVSRLLDHTDAAGIERIRNRADEWTWLENEPQPDGWITLEVIRSVISPHRPQPISQDFSIPNGYRVPDSAFHEALSLEVVSGTDSTITLSGPPGRGKSTYLSYLCEALQSDGIPVIRHHYFLSLTDRTRDRLSPYIVRESMLGQISRFHGQAGAKTEGDADLHDALASCADYYKAQGKRFVVVVDGLDHVWREHGSDKEPLDDVFKQLLPVPDNMLLIVGTQPVADAQLPDRLLLYSPRSTWRPLPPMSEESVMAYLKGEVDNGRLPIRHVATGMQDLADGAHELHKITGGHPLHVIYATEHLINSGHGISKWSVEEIPGDLSSDAKTYYASLWAKLKHVQRDILILLAEFRFRWPSAAFTTSRILPNVSPEDLRAVEHLLYSTPAGLTPFHDSLIVFVKTDAEFEDRINALTPEVERWLAGEAPDRLRTAWLWSVQAKIGNTEHLISGLTRDWILDRLIDGYPIDVPLSLLSDAEGLAFDQRRYGDAYRLRHIKTRLLNGPEFQISDATRLKVCSWKLAKDDTGLDEALSSRHELSIVDLAGLGLSLHARGWVQEGADCGTDALRRHQGDSRFAVDRHNSAQWQEVLSLGRAFGALGILDPNSITPESGVNAGDLRLTNSFIAGATSKMDLAYLFALREKIPRPSRRKVVEDAIIRVAAIAGAQVHRWAQFKTFSNSAVAGCWAVLLGEPIGTIPHTPLSVEWLDATNGVQLARLTHEWFFKAVLLRLVAEGEFSWCRLPASKSIYREEMRDYLDALTGYAEKVAATWKAGNPVGFLEFFSLFNNLSAPGNNEMHKRYSHREFGKTLIQIALDCQAVSTVLGTPVLVDKPALIAAERNAWFDLHQFREAYAQSGVRLITDDAAAALIHHGRRDLSTLADTSKHSQMLLELCEVALLHEMEEEARQLCRLAWDYVLGYGNHKDPSILTVLDAIGYLSDPAPAACRDALIKVAPQVHHITDYTDGDETRHAHSYMNELLAKVDPIGLVEKYADHISEGDWGRADDVLDARFKADLTSPILDAIARTGLPADVTTALRNRAEQQEPRALQLFDVARSHCGAIYRTEVNPEARNTDHEVREFSHQPEDYPPDAFDSLVRDMREEKFYGGHAYLPNWYDFWADKGFESELLRVLTPHLTDESGHLGDIRYVLNQVFESYLKLYGKTKAFSYVVQAQKEAGGWSDFFERSERSTHRLQRVADLYPERADEFIAASCFTWLQHKSQPSPRIIPSDKLVFFLVKLGRLDEANALIAAMIEAIEGDTRNLPLSMPQWATPIRASATGFQADIRLLVMRSKWAIPAVKWWSMQELAQLLTDPQQINETETELYRALESSKLETEVVELLFVFWLGKQDGYVPNAVLSTYIRASSPASLLVLEDIFDPVLHEGTLRSPLIVAPGDFQSTQDFKDVQGTMLPRIFLTILRELEAVSRLPFSRQFAFEWTNTAALYPEAPLQQDIRHFYAHPVEQMVGQFVTRAPHRGRSAYLRTLAVAHDSWNLPDRLVKARTGVALPFDPTLAMLRPQRPAWIPDWGMTAKPEAATISEFLEEMTRRLQTTSSDDILLALSLPLRITETEIIEIEVIRWIQWSTAPIDPPELMARWDGKTKELGLWEMKDLIPTILCPVSALDDVVDANTCAAPTAHKPFMSRHGYLHADLYSRGIPLPLSTTTTVQVSAHPLDGELEIRAEDTHLGRANYWNAGWDTSYPRLGHAFCGTALVADATRLDLLWLQRPLRHFFLWRCTSLLRENSYSAYASKELIDAHFVCSNH